jgi:hypothetical protein
VEELEHQHLWRPGTAEVVEEENIGSTGSFSRLRKKFLESYDKGSWTKVRDEGQVWR